MKMKPTVIIGVTIILIIYIPLYKTINVDSDLAKIALIVNGEESEYDFVTNGENVELCIVLNTKSESINRTVWKFENQEKTQNPVLKIPSVNVTNNGNYCVTYWTSSNSENNLCYYLHVSEGTPQLYDDKRKVVCSKNTNGGGLKPIYNIKKPTAGDIFRCKMGVIPTINGIITHHLIFTTPKTVVHVQEVENATYFVIQEESSKIFLKYSSCCYYDNAGTAGIARANSFIGQCVPYSVGSCDCQTYVRYFLNGETNSKGKCLTKGLICNEKNLLYGLIPNIKKKGT